MEVTEKEADLLKKLRKTNFGRVLVIVKNSQPIRIEETVQYTNLG